MSKCRGLWMIHLLPLDPGIEKLHHKDVLLLGPSHILVQYVREEQELHMIGFQYKHWNDIEGRGLGFVSLIDFAELDKVFVALNSVLTFNNEEVGRALYLIPLPRSVVALLLPYRPLFSGSTMISLSILAYLGLIQASFVKALSLSSISLRYTLEQ